MIHPDPFISIIDSDTSSGELTLDPSGTNTLAKKSSIVHWIIEEDSGVKNITGITPKSSETEVVFVNGDPSPQTPNQGSPWRGRIDPTRSYPDDPSFLTYYYDIEWEDLEGNIHVYDPSIKVNQ